MDQCKKNILWKNLSWRKNSLRIQLQYKSFQSRTFHKMHMSMTFND
jgi:hypothetical protein